MLKRQSNHAAGELEVVPSWLPFSLREGAAQVSGRDSVYRHPDVNPGNYNSGLLGKMHLNVH